MNWLAHLFLSEPSPEFRLGNLLPDLVGPDQLRGLPPEVMRGVACHRRIDAFTDRHVIVRQSIARLSGTYRRFGGILIDVFYDHFLAAGWPRYAAGPLETFAHEVYRSFEKLEAIVPAGAVEPLRRMRQSDFLCSYQTVPGIELALTRIGGRFRKSVNLGPAVAELQREYDVLRSDFEWFFPELCGEVAASMKPGKI